MLTAATIRAARPRDRAYKIFDGRGLYIHVLPSGRRVFRIKHRQGGREMLTTIGDFPDVQLADARERLDALRDVPVVSTPDDSFEAAARRWLTHQRPRWSEVHERDVVASLEGDAFPAIGAMPLGSIDPPRVLELLREVERRGARETARRLRQRISAVFAFAMSEGRASHDPAAIVRRAMATPAEQRGHPAIVELDDARALLAQVDQLDARPIVKLASRFLALTAVRLAALRGASWGEFDGFDEANCINCKEVVWRVPAARMKLAAAKKADAANDHLVPLSAGAVDVLRAARACGAGDLVFAGPDGRAIGEGAIGALYARTSFAGAHVPHGWRATFSTILNERFPEERGAIDRALGHKPKGMTKVEAAYNRAQQLDRRRRLFEKWSDLLCGLSGDVLAE